MPNYWWSGGSAAVIFKAPTRFVSFLGGASQTGTSADPIASGNLQSAIDAAQAGTKFVLVGPTINVSTPLSISIPGIQLIGCGTSDQEWPGTALIQAATTFDWSVVSGNVYAASVTGTVRAVYVADDTAKSSDALFVPILLTRNTSSPTNPGLNEWGQSGGTLSINIGGNPTSRTIWAVNSQGALVTLDQGADDIVVRGLQLGPCAPNGAALVIAGSASFPDSSQRTAQSVLLENVRAFGAWDQVSPGAGNGFQIAIPASVEMRGCQAILCDNDGLNVKQAAHVKVSQWLSDRTGDEGISPHYGASVELEDGIVANSGYLNTADGHGIAVWQGAKFYAKNLRVLNPRGDGVHVGGAVEFPVSICRLVYSCIETGRQETGAAYGTNGVTSFNRAKVLCKNIRVSGFYSQTSGQGNGFFLNNTDADHRTEMHLDGCTVHGCRINVRASLTGTTGGSRLDAFNMTNKTPYHQSFASGSTRYHEFVGGGSSGTSITVNWKTGGTASITSSSATTLSETTGLTDWSYF